MIVHLIMAVIIVNYLVAIFRECGMMVDRIFDDRRPLIWRLRENNFGIVGRRLEGEDFVAGYWVNRRLTNFLGRILE